ncbi:MAG: hypothetical protein JEZ11_10465 [Desulfobacterales bacterium]|nr:hypothetical protein [Desulfobacterales bacterium]
MMHFKSMGIAALAFFLVLAMAPAWGADYGNHTDEELATMRGTMRSASSEERAAFSAEWQKRVQAMSAEDRQKYSGRSAKAAADGSGYRTNAPGSGSGANAQMGSTGGGGSGSGKGNRQRKRARAGGGGGNGKGGGGGNN